jgi:ferredoxin
MIILGVLTLIVGLFVARPYCRFACPLGAMLRLLSPLARRHATITPSQCINCRLCEDACPFNAIGKPTPAVPPRHRFAGKHVLAVLLVLVPVLAIGGAILGRDLGGRAAESHATFRLAKDVAADAKARADGKPSPLVDNKNATNAVKAFRASGRTADSLYMEAQGIHGRFDVGGAVAGGFVGLVVGLKLIGVSIRRRRMQYEIDRSRCVSCARCFEVCPVEQLRRQGKSLPDDAGAVGRGEGR